jgi:hypothetical protein
MHPLFKAIFNHNTASVIWLMGINLPYILTAEFKEHKALQIAAKEGCREIVLHLLQRGAVVDVAKAHQKTAFYYAMENGHLLVARILLACGASKELAILRAQEFQQEELIEEIHALHVDASIVCDILLWVGGKDATLGHHLFDLIRPNLNLLLDDEKLGIVELMAERRMLTVPQLLELLRLNGDFYNGASSPSRLSAGYWVVSSSPIIHQARLVATCYNDHQWIVTLRQLRQFNRQKYNRIFESPLSVNKTYDELLALENVLGRFDFFVREPQLTVLGQELYQSAVLGNEPSNPMLLSSAVDTYEDYSAAILLAYERNNFVAVNTLHQMLDKVDREVLLARFIRNHQHALAFRWFMCSGIESADFALNFPQEKEIIEHIAQWERGYGIVNPLSDLQKQANIWANSVAPYLTPWGQSMLASVSRSHHVAANRYVSRGQELFKVKAQVESLQRFIDLAASYNIRNRILNLAITFVVGIAAILLGASIAFATAIMVDVVSPGALGLVVMVGSILMTIPISFGVHLLAGEIKIEWLSSALNKSSQSVKEAAKNLFASFNHEPVHGFRMSFSVKDVVNRAKVILSNKKIECAALQVLYDKEQLVISNNSMQRRVVSYAPSRQRLGLFAVNDEQKADNVASSSAQVSLNKF